jgi:N-acetyl-gamma-glutamyl-phosphate reductase
LYFIKGEKMLRVGVIGATGYTGEQIIKILLRHPEVRITYISAKVDKKQNISKIFPELSGRFSLACDNFEINTAVKLCDLLFLALPHTVSMQFVPRLMVEDKKVIDLSADYRLKDATVYKKWYKTAHRDKKNLPHAVYGLAELKRQEIKRAQLIANPGCYPTAAILGLGPILVSGLADTDLITIDAKSGLTGAGRKASLNFFFSEINENMYAYKLNRHQHMPEINQELSRLADTKISVVFVPHLIPINRGIIETIYVRLKRRVALDKIQNIYKRFYKTEHFVRVKEPGEIPAVHDVLNTNYCDIGLSSIPDGRLLIITVAIDNLMKGASSQAVQNMNIMCGFAETQGLE